MTTLWAHQIAHKVSTQHTPYELVYGVHYYMIGVCLLNFTPQ
jgi:hypothetical protein